MKNNDHNTEDKLLAAIALSAQLRAEQATASIADEDEWQQFLQHKHAGDQHLLAAIDSDPDRFEEWIKYAKPSANTSTWHGTLSCLFKALAMSSIPMTTAALLLLSVMVFLQLNTQQDPLQQSYAQIAKLIPIDESTSTALKPLLTATNSTFSFTAKNNPQTQLAAFLHGIEKGRQALAPQSKISNLAATSKHPHWQRFGEWYQLNRYVAHSKQSMQANYWQQQHSILQQLDSKLSANPTRSILNQSLLKLQQQPQSLRYQLELKQQLANYWQALLASSDAP